MARCPPHRRFIVVVAAAKTFQRPSALGRNRRPEEPAPWSADRALTRGVSFSLLYVLKGIKEVCAVKEAGGYG